MKCSNTLANFANWLAIIFSTLFCHAADAAKLVEGTLQLGTTKIVLIDAIAMQKMSTTQIMLSSTAFDRVKFAEDGKLDFFDVMGLPDRPEMSLVKISVWPSTPVKCIEVSRATSKEERCTGVSVTLSAHTAERIAGKVVMQEGSDSFSASFDVPIQSKLEPVVLGTPLPSDGGAPAKALLQQFAAIERGDATEMQALTHPSKRTAMATLSAEQRAKQMALARKFTPTQIKVQGGSIDGLRAWVNFSGTTDGRPMTGTAEMEQVDGAWYVLRMRSKS